MKRKLREQTFEAPADADLDFQSITIREVTTRDEMDSSAWAMELAPEEARTRPLAMMNYEIRELIRCSIAAVDGNPVMQPFQELDEWSSRSYKFVQAAYGEINGVDQATLKKFTATPAPRLSDVGKAESE